MKNIQITGGTYLEGAIKIPPSKSLSHRAIIAAALAEGHSKVSNLILSKDIEVTTQCMRHLGAEITTSEDHFFIKGCGNKVMIQDPTMDCHESGSTLRFMIPIGMLGRGELEFLGAGKLVTRPLEPYFDIFNQQGIAYTYEGQLPLYIQGGLKSDCFKMRGDISSQFITGLLYALPLVEGTSTIEITTHLESKGYVDLTLDVLKDFGIQIFNEDYQKFVIPGNQKYHGRDYRVEGDFSQVAFWLVAGILNGRIRCMDMNKASRQGDREVLDIISRMGVSYDFDQTDIFIEKAQTSPTVIDGSQCPDIIPVLTVLAAVTPGETRIINAERLRIKECDRLTAIRTELNKLGANIEELKDGLIIQGVNRLKGGKVSGWNDHRIVMSMAVAALVCDEDVYIEGCDAINKSYPHFFEDFKKLGGQFREWHMEK